MKTGSVCAHFEDALRGGDMDAARRHAQDCPACHRELIAWEEVNAFGAALHREWDAPALWPRIQRQLDSRPAARSGWFTWSWAGTAAALLLTAGAWLSFAPAPPRETASDYLTDQTLREVTEAEDAYVRSIDKLSRLAGATLARDTSPDMAAYREKLVLLDAAIRDLRDTAAENRLNAAVQTELVSLYHEKQQTLKEVLRYAQSNTQRL
jgi:hypothetical protein